MGSAISNSPAPQPDAEALKHLRASATFGDLDDEALGRLAECLIPVKFDAGEVVIEEGAAPDNAYFVVAGRLEVTTVATDGTRRAVGTRGPGDVVGEMALLTGESRSATVTALRDSRLYRMSAESFTEVVMMDPRILLDVTRSIASRLEDAIHDPTPVGAVSVVGVIPAGLEARHRQFAQR